MRKNLLLTLIVAFFSLSLFGAEPIKEFGPSVSFSEEGPAIKMSDLKGKVVLIVFFQSWCPTCNKWSGEKFKNVEKAYAKDRSVVLVALKTDGGGVSGAKNYLKERANLENWIVGSDKDAEYYTAVNGKDDLFNYAIVNGKGELVEKGYFGSSALAKKNFSNGFFTRAFLPKDSKYHEKLSGVVKEAELGLYKTAIVNCRKFTKDKEIVDDAKSLEKDIYSGIQSRITELTNQMKTESDPDRFSYYLELRQLAEALHGMPIQNEAVKVFVELKTDPFFKKEIAAENAYLVYKKNLEIIKKSEVSKYKESFIPKFLNTYKDTYYGRLVEKSTEVK